MESHGWDQLLQESEAMASRVSIYFPLVPVFQQLVTPVLAQDAQGFPVVQRELHQVHALSQALRAKSQRAGSTPNTVAAAKLLGREGIDASQYAHHDSGCKHCSRLTACLVQDDQGAADV